MMPTLRQIKTLNQLLVDLYALRIPPERVIFSRRGDKPFVILVAEPRHEIKEARWYYIEWHGRYYKKYEK